MNRVDDRLNQAAAEVRAVARRVGPPPFETPRRRQIPRAWLAFAGAFAVVVVAIELVPVLLGDEPAPLGSTPTTVLPVPSTTLAQDPSAGECSAADIPAPGPIEGIPEPVRVTRAAIIEAASICDLETLQSLAGDNLRTGFGGGGFENIREWEEAGAGQLGLLLQLLDTSLAIVEVADGPDIYVWPAAFTFESWDEIPEVYHEELSDIFTEGELDQIATFGSYASWRVGIDEEGNWLYFLAGLIADGPVTTRPVCTCEPS